MLTENTHSSTSRKSAENIVYAVGIGPGNPAYLHPRTQSIIEDAEIIIGFETILDCLGPPSDAEILSCTYETESDQLAAFAARVQDGARGVAVLMGDPNVSGYTFVEKVDEVVDNRVEIVPGISSIQIAASRSRTALEESIIVTLHKRGTLEVEFDRIAQAVGSLNALILPRPYDYMPEQIATELIARGVAETLDVTVYEQLTFEDEAQTRTCLGDLATPNQGADSTYSDLSVMVIPIVT